MANDAATDTGGTAPEAGGTATEAGGATAAERTGGTGGTDGTGGTGAGAQAHTMFRPLTARDLINVGIFTALYFVVAFGTGMIGIFNPALMFVGWVIAILLNGIVVALYLARTPKFGALTLMAAIISVLMTLTGHTPLSIPLMIIVGLIADTAFARLRHRPRLAVPLAYALLSLAIVIPLLPILFSADEYFATITEQMGPEYTEEMRALFQPWVIGVWAIVAFVLGWIGGIIGVRAGRRHFSRAGLA